MRVFKRIWARFLKNLWPKQNRKLTIQQQLTLSHSAWRWATAITLLRRPRSTSLDKVDYSQLVIIHEVDAVEWERYTRGLHMLCLALKHLDRCLELLKSEWPDDFPAHQAKKFRAAWKPLKNLRDVLEHEEDYDAGIGKKPSLIDPSTHGWVNIRGVQVPARPHQASHDPNGLVVGYRVQGRYYDLSQVLTIAEDLEKLLREFVRYDAAPGKP